MLDYLAVHSSVQNASVVVAIYSMLMTFILSTVLAITYEKTFRGLSYSRNYVHSMILVSMVTSLVMLAIGDSIGRGLGMIGALAIIRFRTNFKDPKDIIFMFATIAIGISCGVYAYSTAVVGTIIFGIVSIFLTYSSIGSIEKYDGMLKFNIPNDHTLKEEINKITGSYCKKITLISLKETTQGDRFSYSYHLKLKSGKSKTRMMDELTRVEGIQSVSILLQQSTVDL